MTGAGGTEGGAERGKGLFFVEYSFYTKCLMIQNHLHAQNVTEMKFQVPSTRY